MMKCACALVAAMSLMTSAKAEVYRLLPGATDWADPTSYGIGEWGKTPLDPDAPLPGAGDTVFVNANDVPVSPTNTAQWEVFNSLKAVRIAFKRRVIIDVPEGEVELKVRTNNKGWSTPLNYNEGGGLIKRGAGTLIFDTPHKGDARSDHECYVEVEEGAVAMTRKAVTDEFRNYSYGKFTLAEGTRLYLPRREDRASFYRTSVWGFEGKGTVVAEDPSASCYVTGGMESVFEGDFEGDIGLNIGGLQTLANPNCTLRTVSPIGTMGSLTTRPEWNDDGPSFVNIGNPGEPSSMGKTTQIDIGNSDQNGGVIHYIGAGETSSKNFYIGRTLRHPFFLDGGAGGLTLTGQFKLYAVDGNMERIVLEGTGTGAHESKLTGKMAGASSGEGVPCSFVITKRGTGTWSLENTRESKGAFYVQDGTLKFDSIAETNIVSALGYSTMLTENRGIAWTDVSAHVPYAFQLGSTDTNNAAVGKGLMEYTGAVRGRTTTRPVLLNGAGGFANNGEASFRLAGVSAGACTNNTLYLGGSGSGGNELQDLSGEMDVVKEGTGTWFLSGSNTFSGTVSVNGGTLWVRDPAKYTWFRWTVCSDYGNPPSTHYWQFGSPFFGLYDADNRLVSANLKAGGNDRQLAPGEIWLDDRRHFSSADQECALTNMVAVPYQAYKIYDVKDDVTNVRIDIVDSDQSTSLANWVRIALRLPDGTNDVHSYDFVRWGTYMSKKESSVTDWFLEASADGLRWDTVSPRQQDRDLKGCNWFWTSSRETVADLATMVQTAHTNGYVLTQTRRDAADVLPVFDNVTSVKVAKGATLKTDAGADIALRGIEADAAGAGTIENFRIAESGTLAITGVEKGVREFKLPVTFVNVADAANFADWGFTINGAENPNWQMSVDEDGNVSFAKKGLVLIVR